MSVRRFILVAGYQYEGKEKSAVTFRELCEHRMRRLLQRMPTATVIIFDVGAGQVVTSEMRVVTQSGHMARKQRSDRDFHPVTVANYSGKDENHPDRFDTNATGVMSITDVYAFVEKLGADKSTAGSVGELSVFSHGFFNGPILVNSSDNTKDGNPARDPNDKDGRVEKDFSDPNMDKSARARFRKAFASDGICWTWGCSFTTSYFQVQAKLFKTAVYDAAARHQHGPIPDGTVFSFSFDAAAARGDSAFFDDDETFFPQFPADKKVPSTVTFSRTFREIKAFFQRGLNDTYAQGLATASGRPCFGALPGTYADFEENIKGTKYPLMVIPRLPKRRKVFGDDLTAYVQFYESYLGVKEDPEKRGYGRYNPK